MTGAIASPQSITFDRELWIAGSLVRSGPEMTAPSLDHSNFPPFRNCARSVYLFVELSLRPGGMFRSKGETHAPPNLLRNRGADRCTAAVDCRRCGARRIQISGLERPVAAG